MRRGGRYQKCGRGSRLGLERLQEARVHTFDRLEFGDRVDGVARLDTRHTLRLERVPRGGQRRFINLSLAEKHRDVVRRRREQTAPDGALPGCHQCDTRAE